MQEGNVMLPLNGVIFFVGTKPHPLMHLVEEVLFECMGLFLGQVGRTIGYEQEVGFVAPPGKFSEFSGGQGPISGKGLLVVAQQNSEVVLQF
jgi:hypothetical protein